MNTETLKKIAIWLLILLFFMPLIGSLMMSAQLSTEAQQYIVLEVILKGIYNVPFLFTSLAMLIIGRSFQNRLKENASKISFIVSIGSSTLGSVLMFAWALGAF